MRNEYNHFSNANRLFYKALHIVVICILMCVGAMPLSAQVYSTAQRYTPYDSRTNAAYGASYNSNGYAEQPAYNPYQSTVYQPFGSSMPSGSNPSYISSSSSNMGTYNPIRGRRNSNTTPSTDGSDPTNPNIGEEESGSTDYPEGFPHPSDPNDNSNQSPVGEAWVMLLFAAAAAVVVFVRQRKAAVRG